MQDVEPCHFSAVPPPINLQATAGMFRGGGGTQDGYVSPPAEDSKQAPFRSAEWNRRETHEKKTKYNETPDVKEAQEPQEPLGSPRRICILMGRGSISPYEP